MQKRSVRIVALAGFLAVVNCSPDGVTGPGDPAETPLGPTELRPFLTLPSAPTVGSQVTIQFGVKRGTSAPKVGSFDATITYDATAIQFISDTPPADGLVAVNLVTDGTLSVAGAAANGFDAEAIATATVKILKADGLNSIAAKVDEMTTSDLVDKTPASSLVRVRTRQVGH